MNNKQRNFDLELSIIAICLVAVIVLLAIRSHRSHINATTPLAPAAAEQTNDPAQAETPAETNKTSENLQQQMKRLGFSPDSFHRVVVKEK